MVIFVKAPVKGAKKREGVQELQDSLKWCRTDVQMLRHMWVYKRKTIQTI